MRDAIARFLNLNRCVQLSVLAASLALAGAPVFAQTTRPPNLQPVPEPPPPPKGYELDSALEPQITIIRRGNETVEEYRMGGRLYMMKVTPAGGGTPYYLVDQTGDGTFARQNPHDTGLRPPMWLIHSF
jgi:Protein of unknown function (DUF2782)